MSDDSRESENSDDYFDEESSTADDGENNSGIDKDSNEDFSTSELHWTEFTEE